MVKHTAITPRLTLHSSQRLVSRLGHFQNRLGPTQVKTAPSSRVEKTLCIIMAIFRIAFTVRLLQSLYVGIPQFVPESLVEKKKS